MAMQAPRDPWWDGELAGSTFADARLGQRLRALVEKMSGAFGASLPLACQDWASTKAAYRFLSNPRVDEGQILAGHFQATRERVIATEGTILVVQDTTEFSYQRERPEAIGVTCNVNSGRDKAGRVRSHTVCGLLMHASLAVTPDGLPLGLAAVRFWSRQKFKGVAALKRRVNLTRLPIEGKESVRWLENMRQSTELLGAPARCVHIGDRESDIYELFCTARALGTHFLVRSCNDRLAGEGGHTIADEMGETRLRGVHRVEVCNGRGQIETVRLELRYRRIHVLPPIGKQKRYPALDLTVIHAQERGRPVGRPAIDWRLITDLPVSTRAAAVQKLHWYAQRWKIEIFHKILKSGCRAEEVRLRAAERLVRLIAVFCILSWRVFWMTMMGRAVPDAAATLILTRTEMMLLDRLVPSKEPARAASQMLSAYLTKLARLGGYLARGKDPPPGNTVMWRGLSRLTDIELGATLANPLSRCG
jgi:Transposase DNA-binding/Transposase Tn5 dimerisation domain